MAQPHQTHRRWLILFYAVALLVLAQVSWWATLFLREVQAAAHLKTDYLVLLEKTGEPKPTHVQSNAQIDTELQRKRVMFLSESIFFAAMTCFGLFLIYQSLRAEARSREIQKNFVEIVSHESKTPLTALKLRLESLREKRPGDAQLATDVGLMLDEVRRLNGTFDKVMNWNRLEHKSLRKEAVDVVELVHETLKRIEPFLKSRQVAIEIQAPDPVMCLADAQGLSTALQCLFENAALYNDSENRRLTIIAKSEFSVGMVTVRDNGPGIDAEDEAHLFERFFRGAQGKKMPGTGLGLNIAYNLIVAQGGDLKYVRPQGPGAQFEITFPSAKTGGNT